MVDRNTFMETLHSVQEIAGTSDTPMDRETAISYFKDMDLSQEQEEMVYQFLLLPPEELEPDSKPEEDAGTENEALMETGEEPKTGKEPKNGMDQPGALAQPGRCGNTESAHFQLYLDEINGLTDVDAKTEQMLYQKLLSGDTSVTEDISTQWLKRVISIAEAYRDKGCPLEDLVQEGNIGLLMGINALAGKGQAGNVSEQLKAYIKDAIEQYLGLESGEEQQNEAVLGKVALVVEARKLLAEEKGGQPSLRELSDYTRIPAEEITDILSLIKEK